MHNMHRQIGLLGSYIDRITLEEAVVRVHEFIESGLPHQVTTINVDFLRLAQQDPEFRAVINRSDLAIPDGMPLVWASGWAGDKLPERVTGVDLVDRCCSLAAAQGYKIFLLGGEEGVASAAGDLLRERYPNLQIAGSYSPPMGPFSEEEDQKMVSMIKDAQPDILFVAFGAPKQDLWISRHQEQLRVPVAIGVGGVFNFVTGRTRRAPDWMQQKGMEWLYRVIIEPRRLWKRYFINDIPVVVKLASEALKVRMLVKEPLAALSSPAQLTEVPVPVSSMPINLPPSVLSPNDIPSDPAA